MGDMNKTREILFPKKFGHLLFPEGKEKGNSFSLNLKIFPGDGDFRMNKTKVKAFPSGNLPKKYRSATMLTPTNKISNKT